MKIGFTGTRDGMKQPQMDAFYERVCFMDDNIESFHHGDCVGADDDAARVIHELNCSDNCSIKIVCHPPIDESHRAFNEFHDEIRPAKTHFARNRDIVDETDMLVATPREMERQDRGGTWYTVDYARKKGKRVVLILPDGTIEE